MKNNKSLIGVFCSQNKILSLLEKLKYKIHINLMYIDIYKIKNSFEYFILIKTNQKNECLQEINNAMIMHSKNQCFFSINALNELIKQNTGSKNIEYNIDWKEYQNKILTITNGHLSINQIDKIKNKCTFLFN